jgi:Flp pilus assembly protein CpaB
MSNAAKKQVTTEEAATMTVVKNQNDEPIEAVVIEAEPVLTLEQKIHKVETLTMLIDKYHKLQESKRNLETFQLASDGFTNQLSLRSTTSGFEFKTYNTTVVSEVFDVINKTLTAKIIEVESQIKF